MKSKRTWLLLIGLICVVWLTFVSSRERDPMHDRLHAKARKEWKDAAIPNIQKRAGDPAWLENELAKIRSKLEAEEDNARSWFTEEIILLQNGKWVAFASHCAKEDARIFDIFIGRGSDGKWYYSTYHFCVGLIVLRMEGRPQSLAKFISDCSLREFDGRSDECLKRTWPPMTP